MKVWLVIIFASAVGMERFEGSGWETYRGAQTYAECAERKRELKDHIDTNDLHEIVHSARCIFAKDAGEAIRKSTKAQAEG